MSRLDDVIFGMGLYVATALRATEAFRPEGERIYDAHFDYSILPTLWRGILLPGIRHALMASLEKFAMGTPGMMFCRTRFIDDALAESLKQGTKQIVSLGAGFDTRAYRIPGVEHVRFFELDLPAPQRFKTARLKKYYGTLPAHVTFVPIDFDRQSITDELAAAGFVTSVPTFFIWEGVTQYITAEAVDATLQFVQRCAPGSQIAFTYIQLGIIDGSTRSTTDERLMDRVGRRGMAWVFGLDPEKVEGWLRNYRLRLVDHADSSVYRARYVTSVGRQLDIYEGERMALAEVIGHTSQ